MSDFVHFVFSYLRNALVLAVPAALLCAAALFATSRIYKKKYHGERRFPWGRAVLILALVGYLVVVGYVTVLRSDHYGWHYANTHLFRAWREAWNNFSEKNWLNVFLNIAMFVPLGILLPLLHKWFRKWYIMLPTGFLTSLAIEAVQYFSYRGLFDVDDLFTNTLGAMTGFWLVMVVLSAREKQWKRSLRHGLALLAVAVSIGGIFGVYALQEYGNLPDAPAFRVDTRDTEWKLSCGLSGEEQTVTIYKTEPMTKEACEAFGRTFLQNLGVEQTDVWYYNEEVYMREAQGNRIMEVFYQDGHFEYRDLTDIQLNEISYAQADEALLRGELRKLGIDVPADAVYSYEDKWNTFTLERHVDGETMTDGALRCSYKDGFGIREIQNSLVSFRYYGEAEIISEQAAVEKLKAGYLTGGNWFEQKKPRQMEILSCTLSYQVDTKGFYQPVYLIEVTSGDTNYEMTEMIPALK